MSLLLHAAAAARRRGVIAAGALAQLADSLAADLTPLLERAWDVPAVKAKLTRRGGRCERDGVLLEFDPWSPHEHRCPRCGRAYRGEDHDRWWVMGFQLWLAERAVHAAALALIGRGEEYRDLARAILDRYAGLYLHYQNRDNVLGPSRLFFSTYLESIWLLQVAVALDLLELAADPGGLGGRVRTDIIEPAAALIIAYDEGMSNRQVWNNAALLAAARMLGDGGVERHAMEGPGGLLAHIRHALLADGSWYEGENYHLFAHRGLWYAVTILEADGWALYGELAQRYADAFAIPFLTALPDFTFPARRDSQYGVSLRQWRFAELAELGLARTPDDLRLLHALRRLYEDDLPRGETQRARSTAEAERNVAPSALTRADLGWRSLLFALAELPPGTGVAPASLLLPAQGLAVLRRDSGRLYAALDFGHSGGGHGHPDRLNVLLADGARRWLDDYGTGSYVDASLFWYRSTLAHNAPLVDGRSQARADGRLVAFEDAGDAGWVLATADGLAPGVTFTRAVVAMSDYVIDRLTWTADRDVTVDLPVHVDGSVLGVGEWRASEPHGGTSPEDGFAFITFPECAPAAGPTRLDATLTDARATAWVSRARGPFQWWRAVAPGAPGTGSRRFHVVRASGTSGEMAVVWSTRGAVADVRVASGGCDVTLLNGDHHEHRWAGSGWRVAIRAAGAERTIALGGFVSGGPAAGNEPPAASPRGEAAAGDPIVLRPGHPVHWASLGAAYYRRSEESWEDAERPTADVTVGVRGARLEVSVVVHKAPLAFAEPRDENPLDNEHPDINSDGVQVHIHRPAAGAILPASYDWLMVPGPEPAVRVRVRSDDALAPASEAYWAATPDGYRLDWSVALAELGVRPDTRFGLDVIVNEITPGRERRRGQLVLSGARGEWVYLRGDRQPIDRLLPFVVADA